MPGQEWGAVVIDDGSSRRCRDYMRWVLAPYQNKITFISVAERRTLLANMVWAVRYICDNAESVLITLDADDCLIGNRVIETVAEAYNNGADLTVGSMIRTDKVSNYPVDFSCPREGSNRGGNVWQHLRSFRKSIFDAIPDELLHSETGEYYDLASDWAFMVPMVKMARSPVWIKTPLYLYEPSGLGKGPDRGQREKVIADIMEKNFQISDAGGGELS